jgi:hypothetical protein
MFADAFTHEDNNWEKEKIICRALHNISRYLDREANLQQSSNLSLNFPSFFLSFIDPPMFPPLFNSSPPLFFTRGGRGDYILIQEKKIN